mgnify:CR=1 FL=1
MKKKGVEMSMNVIIIAAIGLLILLILAFLVVNYVGKTNEGLKSCSVAYGGICKTDCGDLGPATTEQTDCDTGQKCCKVVG